PGAAGHSSVAAPDIRAGKPRHASRGRRIAICLALRKSNDPRDRASARPEAPGWGAGDAQVRADGHKVPGMAGAYSHVMPEWADRLRAQLQELWETSLHERARLSSPSAVGLVDKLLAPTGAPRTQSGPTLAPPPASRRARLKSRGNMN